MIGDTGCCGFNLHEKGPTLVGILTLSLPMMILAIIAWPVVMLLGLISRKMRILRKQLTIIIQANLRLIHNKKFFPLFRCKLAGRLFHLSPRMSGMVYRSFNLTAFLTLWMAIVLPIILVVRN